MSSNYPSLQGAGRSFLAISRWFILFGLLISFTFTAAWPQNQAPVEAAEPDLSLLRDAYASSAFQTQLYAELGSPMVIPAAAFNPDSNTRTWGFGFNTSYLAPNGDGRYCGISAVHLPDRSLITSFKGYVYDNDPNYLVDIYLYAKPLGSMVSSTTIAQIHTSVASTALQLVEAPPFSPTRVDNAAYTYHVGACVWGIDNLTRLYNVQIDYVRELYLPIISR